VESYRINFFDSFFDWGSCRIISADPFTTHGSLINKKRLLRIRFFYFQTNPLKASYRISLADPFTTRGPLQTKERLLRIRLFYFQTILMKASFQRIGLKIKKPPSFRRRLLCCGSCRIRTYDPLLVRQVL
jgi:hypothetical protein